MNPVGDFGERYEAARAKASREGFGVCVCHDGRIAPAKDEEGERFVIGGWVLKEIPLESSITHEEMSRCLTSVNFGDLTYSDFLVHIYDRLLFDGSEDQRVIGYCKFQRGDGIWTKVFEKPSIRG